MNSTIQPQRFISTREMYTNIPANANHVTVTADIQSGETFLSWMQVVSLGWVGGVYPEKPLMATTDMWRGDAKTEAAQRQIRCVYLYYK